MATQSYSKVTLALKYQVASKLAHARNNDGKAVSPQASNLAASFAKAVANSRLTIQNGSVLIDTIRDHASIILTGTEEEISLMLDQKQGVSGYFQFADAKFKSAVIRFFTMYKSLINSIVDFTGWEKEEVKKAEQKYDFGRKSVVWTGRVVKTAIDFTVYVKTVHIPKFLAGHNVKAVYRLDRDHKSSIYVQVLTNGKAIQYSL